MWKIVPGRDYRGMVRFITLMVVTVSCMYIYGKLFTPNMCSLSYVNYASVKLSKNVCSRQTM